MTSGETILNGRYRLVAMQGSGGMAVIYKAVDQFLGRTVAVKILRPSLIGDPTFITRFRNEARSIANLSHPNIVTVHDVGNDGSTHYMVMEYVEGQDLKKIIRSEGVLAVDRAVDLAIQICAGIGFAHRAGIVHADVKPQNILVTKDYRVKVTDFGIAQALTDTQPNQREEVVWGSPHYFAPEQARGEKPSPASDVYAIGIVMFEMLTGRLPYSGGSQQELALAHLRDDVPHVSEFNPSVPENLSRIVYKVMQKEPSARYRMADQLGHILTGYRESSQAHTASNMPVPPAVPASMIPEAPPAQRPPKIPSVVSPSAFPAASPDVSESNIAVTQRYGPAPVAPQPVDYQQKIPAPYVASGDSRPSAPWDSGVRGSTSQLYTTPPVYDREPTVTGGLDIVTVMLAILALLAVFGLIPLFILVFRAWNVA